MFKFQHCLTTVSLCKESFLNKAKTGLQPALPTGSRVSPAEPTEAVYTVKSDSLLRKTAGVQVSFPRRWEVSENPADLTDRALSGQCSLSLNTLSGSKPWDVCLHLSTASPLGQRGSVSMECL